MRVLIVGGGLVGSTLAAKLSRDGHDVSLIDVSANRVRELSESLDVRVVEGNGATALVLRRAGIEDADLVVATSNSDEVNMIVGLLASALFSVPRIVVRLRDDDHAEAFSLISRDHPIDQADLGRDLRILRTIAQRHNDHLGVGAASGTAGTVRVGDPVGLVK